MSESNGPQLDAACRILTVSSSLAGAKALINRLKALSIEGQSRTSNLDASNDEGGKLNDDILDENIVPWTIVNRYYIADVHFAMHVIHSVSPMVFDKRHTPPAVIYVWIDGEPYAKHVEELSRMMGGYEPEVSLAVRIPKSTEMTGLVEDNSEIENNTDIDTILMSYGFEYIDATGEVPVRRTGDDGNELSATDDIPHLPRVLDALSTIMWPSMKSGGRGSGGGGLGEKSKRERDSILEELLAHDGGTMSASHRDSEDEAELMEQMQDLLRSEELKARGGGDASNLPNFRQSGVSTEGLHLQLPWLTQNSGKTEGSIFSAIDRLSMSPPTVTEETSPFEEHQDGQATGKFSLGFEDDFTVFVSAPARNYQEGEMTPDGMSFQKQQDTFESSSAIPNTTLEPGSAGLRYQSLGSVSDFGGSDMEDEEPVYKSLDDGDDGNHYDDDDIPTKEEIRATSAKIFGTSLLQKKGRTGDPEASEPFDLSQVMSALQQFKTDISGMDNEEERRRAAAKVALGLVYGLEE